jgi:nicotinamidase-related amidase
VTTSDTAVLLVDAQNSFLHQDGVVSRVVGPVPDADRFVAEAARLLAAARAAGIPVVYTRHAFRADYADVDRVFRDFHPEAMDLAGLRHDRWDSAVVDELAPWATEEIVVKTRFDSFLRTDLADVLARRRVSRLAIAGVLTNVCVETTARAAFQHDLFVHVLADCCAALTEDDHHRALTALERGRFAEVEDWREWLARTDRAAQAEHRPTGARPPIPGENRATSALH